MNKIYFSKVYKNINGEKSFNGIWVSTKEDDLKRHIKRDMDKNTNELSYTYNKIEDSYCDDDTFSKIKRKLISGVNVTWFTEKDMKNISIKTIIKIY